MCWLSMSKRYICFFSLALDVIAYVTFRAAAKLRRSLTRVVGLFSGNTYYQLMFSGFVRGTIARTNDEGVEEEQEHTDSVDRRIHP